MFDQCYLPTVSRQRRLPPGSARWMGAQCFAVAFASVAFAMVAEPALGVPYFARKFDVNCEQCHVVPPKLNPFGEEFLAQGYGHPDLQAHSTWPLAVWTSGRVESRRLTGAGRSWIDPFANRVELISGGPLGTPRLYYFAEWRVLSQESRADGSLRDRSGRFEDLFVTAVMPANLELTLGQFRAVSQVDISRRLSLSEPLLFAASLPGSGGGTARQRSLRAFSPTGRSPAARLAWHRPSPSASELVIAGVLPIPGEFSIPLSDEARAEASHAVEMRPKGLFVEAFLRRGLDSLGGHFFVDDRDRFLANLVAVGRRGPWFWNLAVGADRSAGEDRLRWSAEGEYIPSHRWALGLRVEDRAKDGVGSAALPYVTWHRPLRRSRLIVTFEQRLQEDRNASALEVGYLF
jgi:hypothetical protein